MSLEPRICPFCDFEMIGEQTLYAVCPNCFEFLPAVKVK